MKGYTPKLIKEDNVETSAHNHIKFIELGVKQVHDINCGCEECKLNK